MRVSAAALCGAIVAVFFARPRFGRTSLDLADLRSLPGTALLDRIRHGWSSRMASRTLLGSV